jgi:hypothetical protein
MPSIKNYSKLPILEALILFLLERKMMALLGVLHKLQTQTRICLGCTPGPV